MAAFHLRVVGIPDFDPAVFCINAGFSFADHAFEVPLTNLLVQELALSFDVLSKHDFSA